MTLQLPITSSYAAPVPKDRRLPLIVCRDKSNTTLTEERDKFLKCVAEEHSIPDELLVCVHYALLDLTSFPQPKFDKVEPYEAWLNDVLDKSEKSAQLLNAPFVY